MALTSVFYDGVVTETDRAKYGAGTPDYGVYGPDDFKVSTHPSIPYALVVKAGKAHGQRVTDIAATDQTVQCATLSGTGAVRFDLIVVRRNWQPLLGGPSTLVAIQGGATMPKINDIRTIGPGVEDDQPIALVEWRGNVNTPYRIIDLRCWAGSGGIVAVDVLALDYLAQPGALIGISRSQWRYGPGANGTWGWTDQAGASPWANLTLGAGWSTIGVPARARTLAGGSLLQVTGEAKHSNPSIAEGWIIATFPASMRPVNSGFIPGTTDTYNRAGIYVASASGISVGPRPSGNVVQFNGIASLD